MELNGNVAITALAVALCRDHETQRVDRLFSDELAAPLVDAFGPGLRELFTFDNDSTLVELHANIAGRTAFFDEHAVAALKSCAQVVVLGAGLDSRFHRLLGAEHAHWYELDSAELLEVKDAALAELAGPSMSRRSSVPADLTGDWSAALAAAGHRTDLPTLWIVEGVFSYLTAAENDRLVSAVSEASAPGSMLLATHWGPGKHHDDYGQSLDGKAREHGVGFQSSISDPSAWLGGFGWGRVEATTLRAQAFRFDRSDEPAEPAGQEVGWLLAASKN